MRKNELYYELIEQSLAGGKKKEIHEIAEEVGDRMEAEQYDGKKLKSVVYLMKRKGELERTVDGKYYKPEKIEEMKKEPEEILGVWKNGELTINAKLLKHFPEHKIDIRISPDCMEIVLFPNGEEMVNVGKNGRTKNYDLQKRLKDQKKILPAYYAGEWDEEEQLWYGKYLPYNPNKGEKQLKK